MDKKILTALKESNYRHPEIIDIIFDTSLIHEMSVDAINLSQKGFNLVWDPFLSNFCLNKFKNGLELVYKQVEEKGIKIKLIVEITNYNIQDLNELKYHDIRCLDDIRGNFGIWDSVAYMVHIFHQGNDFPDQSFFSNSKPLVEKQLALFDKLWNLSIPLSVKQKELNNQNMNLSHKPILGYNQVRNEFNSLIEYCRKELLIFSSLKIIHNILVNTDFIHLLNSILKRGTVIKILTDDVDEFLQNNFAKINNANQDNPIKFGYSNRLGDFKEMIVVTDNKYMLQIKYDREYNLLGTLSTEEHVVLVQEILFEKYWNEIKSLAVMQSK